MLCFVSRVWQTKIGKNLSPELISETNFVYQTMDNSSSEMIKLTVKIPLPFSWAMLSCAAEWCRDQQYPRDNHRNGTHLRRASMKYRSRYLIPNPWNRYEAIDDLAHYLRPMPPRSFSLATTPWVFLDVMNYRTSFWYVFVFLRSSFFRFLFFFLSFYLFLDHTESNKLTNNSLLCHWFDYVVKSIQMSISHNIK